MHSGTAVVGAFAPTHGRPALRRVSAVLACLDE